MERFEVEDGKVQYTDFIKFAQGNKSDLGGDDDSLVLVKAELREKLWRSARKVRRSGGSKRDSFLVAFQKFDDDGTGMVTFKQFKRCVNKVLKFDLDDEELDVLKSCFDLDGDDRISYNEFLTFASSELDTEELTAVADKIRDGIQAYMKKQAASAGVALVLRSSLNLVHPSQFRVLVGPFTNFGRPGPERAARSASNKLLRLSTVTAAGGSRCSNSRRG